MTVILWIIAVLCVLAGFIGTILPMLPGAPLVFIGLFLASWTDDFQRVGWLPLTVIAILTLLVLIIDFVSTALGAKRVGASRTAVIGAMLGTLAGAFFALPGIIIGPFLGALAGEYMHRQKAGLAARVGFGTWLGLMIGTLVKLAVLFAMIGVFIVAYFY